MWGRLRAILGLRICASIPAKDIHELQKLIREAEVAGADLAEVRLDYMGRSLLDNMAHLRDIVEESSIPLIATNRCKEEGGVCIFDERQRIELLLKAAEMGFEYVDVELRIERPRDIISRVKVYGAKVIVSHHIFAHTPPEEELEKIVEREAEIGADICKIVTMANSIADNIRCLLFTYKMSRRVNLVCFAMGERGLLSRVLSPVFGAQFTYASLGRGFETAPGQITIYELRDIYRRMRIE